MDAIERKARAMDRRGKITIVRTTLGEQDTDTDPVYGAEAISPAVHLTRASWALTGKPWPSYKRSELPFRFKQNK